MECIGNRIKELRKSEDLTQKEFAKRLLVSQSYLSGLENGNELPTNKLIKLICLEFGVNENWLSDNVGEMYDDVYENNKASLVEESNSALLKMMLLFSTKSNVEYGFYSSAFLAFSSTLHYGQILNEEQRIEYLELVGNVMLDFDRMANVALMKFGGGTRENIEKQKEAILKDLDTILEYFINIQN